MNNRYYNADNSQKGMGMIMILIIAAVLLIFSAMAVKVSYSLHKQNRKAKSVLQAKANLLNIQK